jgi:hypothetical protein
MDSYGERRVRQKAFPVSFLGSGILVTMTLYDNKKTILDFECIGSSHRLVIEDWMEQRFSTFLQMFFKDKRRDPAMYGMVENDAVIDLTYENKVNAIIQACKDIMTCLEQICQKYWVNLLSYSSWYLRTGKQYDSYSSYITFVTVHAIVHSDFLAANIQWELVEFREQ